MTIVGGLDVHRKQITCDYVDTDTGLVRWGQIRPATRKTLRGWLGEHCPDGEFAVEGCTGSFGSPHVGHPIHHHVAGPSSVDPDRAGRRHARRYLPHHFSRGRQQMT
jgi:hypothetical protein